MTGAPGASRIARRSIASTVAVPPVARTGGAGSAVRADRAVRAGSCGRTGRMPVLETDAGDRGGGAGLNGQDARCTEAAQRDIVGEPIVVDVAVDREIGPGGDHQRPI